MNGLDLFSGIGGIGIGLRKWVRTVAYCEIERYCQGVLLSRMESGDIEKAPIWDDVRTLTAKHLPPPIDIIFGGFPCQDISVAGAGKGLAGERSGLFFEIARLVEETNPRFVFLENVPAIRTRGLNVVIQTLTELGYDCRWTIVSAAEVGAPHLRKRWFLLAYANSERLRNKSNGFSGCESTAVASNNGEKEPLANTDSVRKLSKQREYDWASNSGQNVENAERNGLEESRDTRISGRQANTATNASWWAVEPDVGRVVNGLPHRVDRIKSLGNSVVPQQVEKAFKKLMGVFNEIN